MKNSYAMKVCSKHQYDMIELERIRFFCGIVRFNPGFFGISPPLWVGDSHIHRDSAWRFK